MDNQVCVGLCEGRHPLPVDEYVFGQVIDNPMDFAGLEAHARQRLEALGGDKLVIYATGLTAALLAVIKVAKAMGYVKITVMHFDRDTGGYMAQAV